MSQSKQKLLFFYLAALVVFAFQPWVRTISAIHAEAPEAFQASEFGSLRSHVQFKYVVASCLGAPTQSLSLNYLLKSKFVELFG